MSSLELSRDSRSPSSSSRVGIPFLLSFFFWGMFGSSKEVLLLSRSWREGSINFRYVFSGEDILLIGWAVGISCNYNRAAQTNCKQIKQIKQIKEKRSQQSIVHIVSMNSNLNLHSLLNNPIEPSLWPQLETIIKLLKEYKQKCVRNREYGPAQKAKDKIEEAEFCIKQRFAQEIDNRMMENISRLQAKHESEKSAVTHEWDMKLAIMEQKYQQIMDKKIKQNEEEVAKLREQVEQVLPLTFTPDEKLKNLRHEEKKLAEIDKFVEAQKVKDQIQHRERQLEEKHRRLREANIKAMLEEVTLKHEKELKDKQKQIKISMDEVVQEKCKRIKELEERHAKEIRETKWIHSEEKRLRG